MNVVVVGQGKVGRALAEASRAAGLGVRTSSGRALPKRLDADLIFVAVPDAVVATVARGVAIRASRPTVIVHLAGRLDAEALGEARNSRHAIAVCHPMLSFADTRHGPSWEGATFVVAGDRRALATLRRFARALVTRVLVARVHGPAYHAAAALVANGTVALAHAGVDVLRTLGIPDGDAAKAVTGLLRSVAENVERVGVPKALTGPIVRGDADTVRSHRTALAAIDWTLLAVYDGIAPAILRTAMGAGLSPSHVQAIRRALKRRPGRRR